MCLLFDFGTDVVCYIPLRCNTVIYVILGAGTDGRIGGLGTTNSCEVRIDTWQPKGGAWLFFFCQGAKNTIHA